MNATVQRLRARRGAWAALHALLVVAPALVAASPPIARTPLPGAAIPQFQEPLPTFVGARVRGTELTVRMQEFQQKVLPDALYAGLPAPFDAGTFVWGYAVGGRPAHYPGYTVEARRFVPTKVKYVNALVGAGGGPPFLQQYLPVDQTLHWADPLGLGCFAAHLDVASCFLGYRGPVPAVTHLHGGEVPSAFDGGPDQWFTPDGRRGDGYRTLFPTAENAAVYRYPNTQEAATLWFHDHALGATRLNVYGGLAAFYLLRDLWDTGRADNPARLPAGAQEIELAIQDRRFDVHGKLLYPVEPTNPEVHPSWSPEFFGDTIVVNGETWPYLEVEPRRYRFRILNGSNARWYRLMLEDASGAPGPVIWQLGTDGGLLDAPAPIAPPARLTLGPGERADVLVDFAQVPPGAVLTLVNDAPAPFPDGDPVDPATTGRILQLRRVGVRSAIDTTCDPALGTPWEQVRAAAARPQASDAKRGDGGDASKKPRACLLRPLLPMVRLAGFDGEVARGVEVSTRRQLVLNEVMGPGGPLEVLLNNTLWSGLRQSSVHAGSPEPVPGTSPLGGAWLAELPRVGSTEVWELVNLTGDAHPIHLHLVQFQLLGRQAFDAGAYTARWESEFPDGAFAPGDGPPNPYGVPSADGAVGGNPAVGPFLVGGTVPPDDGEAGWKDTIQAPPGMITRIAVRFAPQSLPVSWVRPGVNFYPFDPAHVDPVRRDRSGAPGGPGYVWHCHILEHEDNEMMRPYAVVR